MSGQFGLDEVAEDVASSEDEIDRVMRLVVKAVATATKKVPDFHAYFHAYFKPLCATIFQIQ